MRINKYIYKFFQQFPLCKAVSFLASFNRGTFLRYLLLNRGDFTKRNLELCCHLKE